MTVPSTTTGSIATTATSALPDINKAKALLKSLNDAADSAWHSLTLEQIDLEGSIPRNPQHHNACQKQVYEQSLKRHNEYSERKKLLEELEAAMRQNPIVGAELILPKESEIKAAISYFLSL